MSFLRGIQLAGFAKRHLGRMSTGRREVMAHLEAPSDSNLPMPTFVQLRVTNLCNLRCKMCGQWGDTGIYRSDGFSASATDGETEGARIRELIGLNRQLALSDYVRILDEIAPWSPIVSLFGGEPLLYPDILPLVREIKKRGLTCTIITNGGRLEQYARELVEAGIDSIAVSIDGPPDVHNRIRGKNDAYQKVEAGVRAVADWRAKLKRPMPMTIAIFPITELNADVVPQAVEALRKLPIDTINVGLRWFVPKEVGSEYESVMRETFGVAGDSWKGFLFDSAVMNGSATKTRQMTDLVKLLKSLKRRRFLDSARGKPWTSFVPDVPAEKVPEYFADFGKTFGVAGDSWKGFLFDSAVMNGSATKTRQLTDLVKLLKSLKRRRFLDSARGKPWTSFVPDVPAEKVPEYFADFGKTFGHNLCPVAWYFAQVEPDGDVTFCGDFPDYVIGNVQRQTFRDVWTGEKASRFREKLAREPLPICNRCCGNFVYGKWDRPGPVSARV